MKSAVGTLLVAGALLFSPRVLAGDGAEETSAKPEASAVAALAEPNGEETAPAVPKVIVAIDPRTGRLRAPTPEERRALIEKSRRSLALVAGRTVVETDPDGRKRAHLGPEFFRWSLVRKNPDGTLSFDCLPTGAVPGALAGSPVPARVEK
jgi:hypothetical protein